MQRIGNDEETLGAIQVIETILLQPSVHHHLPKQRRRTRRAPKPAWMPGGNVFVGDGCGQNSVVPHQKIIHSGLLLMGGSEVCGG